MPTINWGLIAPLLVIQFVLLVIALIDLKKQERANGSKWIWVLVILFGNLLGPIIYFVFGRGKDR
ncbi:PLD nuclease N-terminal domain-containing protein [Lederbergia lenta]|uniref:Putative negative regulator of sigma Y YxlE n=1 Tax=Lederbergia lenta TaxID=1467 RepID=A0A2X4W155_LEDLE|nr:PLD nuclease N-terminal domain-containing protein [Lederbergia lenta]MEC2323537.1 PLD nuclease N-terminal domain-containing protein [Lederbergia lenta]SQI52622.1 putative negative regulator of sigma Y YxlE [Lederbergia lenta]